MIEEILQRIESAGVIGIKKVALKKTYGKDCEEVIKSLQKEEKIFIEKKGVAYFVWSRDNYVSHLAENDPKCKLMLNMVSNSSHSIPKPKEQIHTFCQTVDQNLQRTDESIDFETEFNKCICELGTAVGWAPFSKIREKVCQTKNLSKERFYSLAANLVENHHDRYEISSGGPEGVVLRGLVHGYVRNL
jgi:hypothetical protein